MALAATRRAPYPAPMVRDDDDPWGAAPRPKPASHQIGQARDTLSVAELEERIALLTGEIARLEEARHAKGAANEAAAAMFRSGS